MSYLHEGHQGIERCRLHAKYSVWWPTISKELTQTITNCSDCARDASCKKQPLKPTPLPEFPRQMVGTEQRRHLPSSCGLLFEKNLEVIKLSSTVSASVIAALKRCWQDTGFRKYSVVITVPNTVQKFAQFAKSYGICHITSTPRYLQSNGQVERMVQSVKRTLKKSYLGYRETPLLGVI